MPTRKAGTKAGTSTLKNAYARRTTRPIDTIQEQLAAHGAKAIHLEYDAGQAVAIAFFLELDGRRLAFRLPARLEQVRIKLYDRRSAYTDVQQQQAYVTAWANIRDWVTAQLAIIAIGLVKTEEVFFPYLLVSEGTTVFDVYEQQQFALPALVRPEESIICQ